MVDAYNRVSNYRLTVILISAAAVSQSNLITAEVVSLVNEWRLSQVQ